MIKITKAANPERQDVLTILLTHRLDELQLCWSCGAKERRLVQGPGILEMDSS